MNQQPQVIAPARLFTGDATRCEEGWGVLVFDDQIRAVGPLQSLPDAPRTALPDCTLLPGLIDLHNYLSVDPNVPNPMLQIYGTDLAQRAWTAARNLRRDLRSGVTTLRVMGEGGAFDTTVRDAVEKGAFPAPHLVTSGHPITPTGGHQAPPDGGYDGVEGVREGVRRNLAHGVEWIKLVLTGGVNSVGLKATEAAYSEDEIRAACNEAASHGVRVAAAAHGGAVVATAARAGVSTIEHGVFFGEREITAVAENEATLVLTPSRFFHPDGIEKSARHSPAILATLERARQNMRAFVPRALAEGVTMALGTDNNHGFLPIDVGYLVEFGARPADALRAATAVAARVLGNAEIGRVAPGCRADLVAVSGNPLVNIAHLRDVRWVMKTGKVVELSYE